MSEDAKLTPNQVKVLVAVKRWKAREQVGALVSDLHCAMRGGLSGDAIRSNLVKLRAMGLVWSYGCSMKSSGTCWHPDPPNKPFRPSALATATDALAKETAP